ncbi:MAG TPA: hypothetical protein VFB99_24185 [Vicinamibacterales bacterium]|nr:hypothetical protein [Vicinamibacterales bacterium]
MEALSNFLVATGIDYYVATYDWVWPVCETLHFVGMCVLLGTVGVVDLRILGVAKGIPIHLLEKFIPLGVIAFLINAATGFVFVAGNPVGGPMEYLTNLSLQLKMLMVLIAGINLLIFYFAGIQRSLAGVAADGDAAGSAKLVAAVSLTAWIMVIIFGRFIMYNDTLLYFLGL